FFIYHFCLFLRGSASKKGRTRKGPPRNGTNHNAEKKQADCCYEERRRIRTAKKCGQPQG
ncbi:MAG: hypothetical protein LUF26_04565, partial [Firmicutes bacterium]|nr:hypothetical protein [Bacillota bacterium]